MPYFTTEATRVRPLALGNSMLINCSAQRDYESAFHRFKPDKHLRWLQHIGTATVNLELSDRTVEAEATPLQASIAELFEASARWTVTDLCDKLCMSDQAQIRNALAFWAGLGVFKEDVVRGDWRLLENAEEGEAGAPSGLASSVCSWR